MPSSAARVCARRYASPACSASAGSWAWTSPSSFKTTGFVSPPLLLSARQRHRLLRLLPRLGDPSEDEVGLGQQRDGPRTDGQKPHRHDRFDRLLQQRHRIDRASRPDMGGAQQRRDERKREANLRRPADREARFQHPGCRREVPAAQMRVPEAPAGPDLAVGMARGSVFAGLLPRPVRACANSPSSARAAAR